MSDASAPIATGSAADKVTEALPPPSPLYRWLVMLAVSSTLFGSYYLSDALGLGADQLKAALGISDTQYGLLSGSNSLGAVLTIFVGGIIIDRIGSKRSMLLFGCLTALSGLVMALAPSYQVMLAGRFLLGVGSEPLIVAVSTALVRWFKGRELAFAFGCNLTLARLGSVAADRSPEWASRIYAGQSVITPLGLAALLGLCCVVGALAYFALEHYARPRYALGKSGNTDKLRLADLTSLSYGYWLLVGLSLTFYSAVFPFQSFATKFFIEAHGMPREQAGALLSYLPGLSMLLLPLLGLLLDRFGGRALMMWLGSLLVAPVYFLLTQRGLPPHLPILMLGLGFSLIPAALWPAVSFAVAENRLGTAYALMTFLQQLGFFAVSWALGWANDAFAASATHPSGYEPGMWLLTALSVLGLSLASLLWRHERARQSASAASTPA
jgi:predicted MFS family arabinose efflux permease